MPELFSHIWILERIGEQRARKKLRPKQHRAERVDYKEQVGVSIDPTRATEPWQSYDKAIRERTRRRPNAEIPTQRYQRSGNNAGESEMDQPLGRLEAIGPMPGAAADRYLPEPAVAGTGVFQDMVDVAKGAVGAAFSSALPLLTLDGIRGGTGASSGDFSELISLQIEAQQEMQVTSLVSNIEKSKHESKMSAIRNIRVG